MNIAGCGPYQKLKNFLVSFPTPLLVAVLGISLLFFGCQDRKIPDTGPSINKLKKDSAVAPVRKKWGQEVLYSIMVDRFHDGVLGKDPLQALHPSDFHGGNLAGIEKKLFYLKELGITAIVLNPITDTDAYHGYSVTDHFSVCEKFGTLEGYKTLVKGAHKQEIKVIFDFVLNHMSGNSKLFKRNPGWFRMRQSPLAINDHISPEIWTKLNFFGLPDLIQEDEQVYQYLLKVAKFWIDTGIDGFRMDAVTLIMPQFWNRFNRDIKAYAGEDFLILGEIFSSEISILNRYLPAFDAFFDFRNSYAIGDALSRDPNVRDPLTLRYAVQQDLLYGNKNAIPFTFIDNHDLGRFVSKLPEEDRESKLRLALAYQMTMRGVPTLLYGTEIGLTDHPELVDLAHDRSRSVMKFSENSKQPLFRYVQKLISIRRGFDFNTDSRIEQAAPPFYIRYLKGKNGEARLAIHNFGGQSHGESNIDFSYFPEFPRAGRLEGLLFDQKGVEIKTGIVSVSLGPYQSQIFSVQEKATKIPERDN